MNNAADLLRLIHNLIRLGTIAEVDHDDARVRVRSGELLTDWRPWISLRAGTTRDWDPPTVGEQVVLFSPGGDPAAGVALVGLYSDAHPAPANSGNLWRRTFPDGAVLEYDHAASHLQATLPGSAAMNTQGDVTVTTAAKLTATAAAGATINANTVINGNLTLNGNFSQPAGKTATMAGDVAFTGAVTSNGKDISSNHKHNDVQPGDGTSGDVV
ncbi:baseplate assembly protein [Litchfieldella anticariensis FP35 = DSM 16096]|uniref:Baseplate assembly protein n=1 Tax=Litchfieldella anticariensis (strain DSM 16096 / CECT 5854 / CIP 108499 / LMG 22089 / FP35) TaxID=1121939 RepID=S2KPM5_LITA3|nr:phage baseplate assembly protein V [Halomonas anticariensis]EPC02413.1 baseplate assembly protein [Halomonas anticariensis FP35 = DSM 16096]